MSLFSKPGIIRLAATLAGALAVIVLFWLLGPLAGLDGAVPLAVFSAVVLLLWAGANYYLSWRASRAEAAMISDIVQPGKDNAAASAEEVQILGEALREAMAVLRKAGAASGAKDGDRLYALPWYIIVGPPGSGKTTALLNSGLKFPLADRLGRKPVKGIGGTRNCDWWFTDEALLIDTAGRYTTQDSRQAVDQAGWLGFLDLLKTHRKRQPINGVLVAISLADLATLDPEERASHADAVKARLRELHERFGLRVPVYVLFTKADLIAGFVEFFEDLGREEREQVLGMTFPLDDGTQPDGAVALFGREFDAVVQRLNDRLLDRVHQERDLQRRALIFAFPGQFASMRELANQFLTEVFQPSRFDVAPLLRGVYFTSGTQEGTPVDRLLGSMAAVFGISRSAVSAFAGSARSYFITRLLREVVFPEAGVVGVDETAERRSVWVRRGVFAGLALLVLAVCGLWTASYFDNERLIAAVAAETDTYRKEVTPFAAAKVADAKLWEVLPLLNRLRGMPAGYEDQQQGRKVAMGLGLYQGGKLGVAEDQAYRQGLVRLLQPRLLVYLGDRMRAALDRPDELSDPLKAYLMVSGQGRQVDAAFVRGLFQPVWATLFSGPGQEAERKQMAAHLDALLAERPEPMAAGEQLVAAVRKVLKQEQPASHAYRRLAASQTVAAVPEWRPADRVDANLGAVFQKGSGGRLTDGIPGRFTVNGYRAVLPLVPAEAKAVRDESWVLGLEPTDPIYTDLERALFQLYLNDYARAWDSLLTDLTVKPPANAAAAAEIARQLSGSSSLVVRLLEAVRGETVLPSPLPAATPPEAVAAAFPWLTGPLREFNSRFQPLNALLQDNGGRSPDFAAALDSLKASIAPLSAVAATEHGVASGVGDAAGEAATALRRLSSDAGLLPPPVRGWVQAVAGVSPAKGIRAQLDAAWKADVLPWCKKSLEGRYPFAGSGAPDMAMDDFSRLFAPGGLFDTFFTTRLARYVDTASRPWRWQTVDNTGLGIPAGVLTAFEKARAIRDGFFPDGGRVASVRFDLRASGFGPSTQEVLVDVDGQQYTFRRTSSQATQMVWPNPAGPRQAWVTLTGTPPGAPAGDAAAAPAAGAEPVRVGQDGPWAWFRLVQGRSQRIADRFNITVGGGSGPSARQVVLEMRPGSVVNPFTLTEMRDFQCPAQF